MNKGLGNKHTIHSRHQHLTWDKATPAALTVAPGEKVTFEEIDAVMGQIAPDSGTDVITNLDFARVNPVAGPVYVDGAEPGDALKVTLLDFSPSGWAWTAIVPGFGLLADDFPEAALNIWSCDKAFAEPAAMAYLVANLGGDRGLSRRELEKLALYVGQPGPVTLAQAEACV
ncbi:MAG: acetamidase/formamidase family protein, partial [Alphaproteobacteria bacterium]|nr:acetamidase/formamidase family protein [Alphaproteobacteria bacterium]